MPLSRLENFLKNIQGNVIYVDPNELDATDSIENQGNSQTRPFKTIQRALIEASRFSYVAGQRNDKFDLTTIILSAGTHYVDNRPGWIPYNSGSTAKYYTRFGDSNQTLSPFGLGSNFDLTSADNELYKLNSVRGGVIIPRGTSIVGKDLRKTKVRPKYVPDPENNLIEPSPIFLITGACYISQFTIFDGDPAGNVYKDYTSNLYTPSFSHHKLTCFEFADGANTVSIKDSFLNVSSTSTDLDMYYQKVGDVYDAGTGRPIEPDFPSGSMDFQTRVEEYRIVGSKGQQVGISSIKAGDGSASGTVITVDMESSLTDLSIDTPIRISGIATSGYDGIHVVSEIVSDTQFKYVVGSAPNNPLPTITSANVNVEIDTVNSASPYLFNLSKRSVFGMNGILLDGDKVTGFKSGLMAQFTGNGLQKDDKAFVRYNKTSGQYDDYTSVSNLHLDPEAIYKPDYPSYHVKVSNDAIAQVVSVFAIGHKNQYVADSGAELSLSNCNANFGENALMSEGYKKAALGPDNSGYITHIIPPKQITDGISNVDYLSIDVDKTVSVGASTRLYFEGYTNQDVQPPYTVDGYRIGANLDDRVKVQLNISENTGDFQSRIVMPTATGITTNTGEKRYIVDNAVGVSSISSNAIIFKSTSSPHNLIDGESVRIYSENGFLPDGLEEDTVYYAIVSGVASNAIKVARTLNDALEGTALTLNNTGGELTVVSKVSDKMSGDIGHPIQFDIPNKNWYINVSNETVDNEIYPTIIGVGTTSLGQNTPKTYFSRVDSSRGIEDSIYKFRYVIPAGITTARPPIEGYVIQESSDTSGQTDAEITTTSLTNIDDQRNFHFLSEASWVNNVATVISEEPHNLDVGAVVNVNKITSANNATGIGSSGFNGRYSVIGITSDRGFQYSLSVNPGASTLDPQTRTVDNLANFEKNESKKSFYVYRSEEVKKHITGEQDGIYHLTTLHYDVKPTVAPFTGYKFSQPVKDLYPQVDRDNPVSDPDFADSHAVSNTIGKVVSSDLTKSITNDTKRQFLLENGISVGISSIVSDNGAGLAHTAYLDREHTLNSILSVGIADSGSKYGTGTAATLYGAKLRPIGIGSTAKSSGATANVTVDANGGITAATIVNGGGAYGIGHSLEVIGITTQAGYTVGVLTVTNIYSGIGQVISISGISSETNFKLNNTFKVTDTPSSRQVSFASTEVIDFGRSLGSGTNNITVGSALSNASLSVIGPSIGVTALSYDINSGIATVGTGITAHGLLAGSKVKLVGAGQTTYRGEFIVKENVGLTTFAVNIGVSTVSAPTLSGEVFAFPAGYSSADGSVTADDEKIGSRMNSLYVGITTTLSAGITSTSSSISITNATASGFNIGDYIMVNDEMMRIKNTSINSVFRGILGTKSTNHTAGTIIRKVKVVPVELRRNSLIRAANQTFEYVGFGQGNYSVALPEKQTKVLSTEDRKLGQTQKRNGGQNYYTGLNDNGEYFIGNKVIKGTTGEEEIFDAPITTVTGEEKGVDTTFSDSLNVSGGSGKDALSEFGGPALFTNKITSTSSEGIETVSVQLQGDAPIARKVTVGIATPTIGGAAGDVTFNTKPTEGGYVGWVYTAENSWRRFGLVSVEKDAMVFSADKIGIGTTAMPSSKLKVMGSISVKGSDSNLNAGGSRGFVDTDPNGMRIGVTGGGDAYTNEGIGLWTADNQTGNTEQIRISPDGTTGIGSTQPTDRLDVNGTAKFVNQVTSGISTFNDDVNFTGGNGYNAIWDKSADHLRFEDNAKACFGTSTDLQIYHDSTDSYIRSDTGELRIDTAQFVVRSKLNNEKMILATGDGSVDLFFNGGTYTTAKLSTFADGISVVGLGTFTTGVYTKGSSEIDGDFKLVGAGATTYAQWKKSSHRLQFYDNSRVDFGDSHDLRIYHTGTDSYIDDHGTGELKLRTNQLRAQTTNNETMALFEANGAVKLYYDEGTYSTAKFETTSTGWKSPDNAKGAFGEGSDLLIYHDGTDSFIQNDTGELRLDTAQLVVRSKTSNEHMIVATGDGSVDLFFNGGTYTSAKLSTTATGINILGTVVDDGATHDGDVTFTGSNYNAIWNKSDSALEFADNAKAEFGNSADLKIYHDGTDSKIQNGTGELQLTGSQIKIEAPDASNVTIQRQSNSENLAVFDMNDGVSLYFIRSNGNAMTRLETKLWGVDMSGGEIKGAIRVPDGPSNDRPGDDDGPLSGVSPQSGMIRWNTDNNILEFYGDDEWCSLGDGDGDTGGSAG